MAKDVVARDFTINLHKSLYGFGCHKKAPQAIKSIKKQMAIAMKTKDVRIDTGLNKFLWSKGKNNVAFRVRVRASRLRNTAEGKENQWYTVVSHVVVPQKDVTHLRTETVEQQQE
jgi:large subunit ribosomal protein L31e